MNLIPGHDFSLCRPEGSLIFHYPSNSLFDESTTLSIFDRVAGRHAFRVERHDNLVVSFRHGCPGTGTQVASVDLQELERRVTDLWVCIGWAPGRVTLDVGDWQRRDGVLLQAESDQDAAARLVVGHDGEIYEIGDVGVEVASFHVYENEELVVEPAAIELWRLHLEAVETLRADGACEDLLSQVVRANAILTMLVTAFEVYGQARFRELAGEGIQADLAALVEAFPRVAAPSGESARPLTDEERVIPYTLRTGVNFQNYGDFKKAFRVGYGLKIGDGLQSDEVRDLKAAIVLRHRAIHVSPMEALRNQSGKHPIEYVNDEYAAETASLFDQIVGSIHRATLSLRPQDCS